MQEPTINEITLSLDSLWPIKDIRTKTELEDEEEWPKMCLEQSEEEYLEYNYTH